MPRRTEEHVCLLSKDSTFHINSLLFLLLRTCAGIAFLWPAGHSPPIFLAERKQKTSGYSLTRNCEVVITKGRQHINTLIAFSDNFVLSASFEYDIFPQRLNDRCWASVNIQIPALLWGIGLVDRVW